MGGERLKEDRVTLPPKSLVVRQSSDIVAVADADVGKALRYIRQNATRMIGVEDVLREVAVSRRKLERDFQRIIGRTIFAGIRRLRIEKAQRLLATTDLAMPAIAAQSGFEGARRLAVVFGLTVRYTAVRAASVLGWLCIAGAAVSGAASVNAGGAKADSLTMAILTFVAMACYGVNLYVLGEKR